MGIAPGSRQVLSMLAANGALADLVRAGARILESACGPCIGLGLSPAQGAISLRTFNRNFPGRSGTEGDQVYLVSPQTAVASALTGRFTDPRTLEADILKAMRPVPQPRSFLVDDGMIQPPLTPQEAAAAEVVRGATIVKPPAGEKLPARLEGAVLIKVGDKITTDTIMPAGDLLKHRSNVPEYSKYLFNPLNKPGLPTFAQRATDLKASGRCGVVLAGESYGQGSSREHAALCPMYLGIRAVLAKGIERIHQANLVNFAILPLVLANPADYDRIEAGDELVIDDVAGAVASAEQVTVRNKTKDFDFACALTLSPRQRKILAAGGLLNYTREGGQ
jgi:aconitate hydratase